MHARIKFSVLKMDTKVEIDIGYKGFGEHVLSIRRYFYKDGKISLTMIECRHKLYDRLYESVGKINHLIEKGSFEKIWLDELPLVGLEPTEVTAYD